VATSGTVGVYSFTIRKVVDHAFRRCRIRSEQITAEMLQTAQDQLFLMLSSFANRKVPLWRVQKTILPIYQNQITVDTPVGTVDLRSANIRTTTRLDGTYTSSAGGTVALAFDDDFDTACTQVSTNGNISMEMTSATIVTTVGVLPGVTASWNLVVERSDDGATWTECLNIGAVSAVDRQWLWYDIDGSLAATYIRLRETGGGTLSVRELYFGTSPNEIVLARLSLDSYSGLPNKTFPGQPSQFWFDRRREVPQLNLWPVANSSSRYWQIVSYRHTQIEDPSAFTQEVDAPQRWYEAIVWQLAWRLAQEFPEVDDQRISNIEGWATRSLREAEDEERDDSPIYFAMNIAPYTS